MSIYQNLFDLLSTYIYGGVELTADMNLVCTLVSTLGCLFLVSLPFVIVIRIVKFLSGGIL